jgi:hypothetical protein
VSLKVGRSVGPPVAPQLGRPMGMLCGRSRPAIGLFCGGGNPSLVVGYLAGVRDLGGAHANHADRGDVGEVTGGGRGRSGD